MTDSLNSLVSLAIAWARVCVTDFARPQDFSPEHLIQHMETSSQSGTVGAIPSLTLSLGRNANRPKAKWQVKTFTFSEFAERMSQHQLGGQDGPCFLQGECVGDTRKAASMKSNSILVAHVETGATMDEVEALVRNAELAAVIYTCHGHLDDTSQFNRDRFYKWAGVLEVTAELCAEFLATSRGVRAELLEGLEVVSDGEPSPDGILVTVKHRPLPKLRVVFALSEPFIFAKRAGSPMEAVREWKERAAGVHKAMDIFLTEATLDPSHPTPFPSHNVGCPHETRVIEGKPLDLNQYERERVTRNRGTKKETRPEPKVDVNRSVFFNMSSDWVQEMAASLASFSEEEAKHLLELNEQYALVSYRGETRIACFRRKAGDPIEFYKVSDIRDRERNRIVWREDKPGKSTKVYMFNEWMEWTYRRQYEAVRFSPGNDEAGVLNLFRGLAIEPKQGDWSLLQDHLLNNVCQGNNDHYEYIILWLAHLIQRPHEKPGVAIVIQGKKGTGKSKPFEFLTAMLNPYFFKSSDRNHFLGNFNAQLAQTLLLICEEAFWAGDQAAESKLKDLITESDQSSVAKGHDARMARSYARAAMLSNAEWVVPATFDERRFFVLKCGDARRNDHAYFERMTEQMFNEGGLAAMVYDLLNYVPVDGWLAVRKPPQSQGLDEQKVASLQGLDRFMYELALHGSYEPDDDALESIYLKEHDATEIEMVDLRKAAKDFLRDDYQSHRSKTSFATIQRAAEDWFRARVEKKRGPTDVYDRRVIVFPPLVEARELIAELKRIPMPTQTDQLDVAALPCDRGEPADNVVPIAGQRRRPVSPANATTPNGKRRARASRRP